MPFNELPCLPERAALPPPQTAWSQDSDAPGLLAAGGSLDRQTLLAAYSNGIFPWFSAGQPILWWSPDPRMVLLPKNFRLHRSLRRVLQRFVRATNCEIRIDSAFEAVIGACSASPRRGQHGTWIVPDIVRAYTDLHRAGFAHSVETWIDDKLVGGLYCVATGNAVFGESMFAHTTDASKIALSALIALCRQSGVTLIDCQQNTGHLASLGASEMKRADFLLHIRQDSQSPGPDWHFSPLYWAHVLSA